MKVTDEQLKEFYNYSTGNICDCNGKVGNMDPAIKPIDPKCKLVGRAVTVQCNPRDNLIMHKAIYEAKPGDVIVYSIGGYVGAGPFGDIMACACQERGIAGVVIDGACRDAEDMQEMGFPVFCRALNPGGTLKESIGTINKPIVCGGIVVNPGDIIVGDRDGVVVVPAEKAYEVLEKTKALAAKEMEIKELLKAGKTTLEIYGFDKILEQKGYD
ncbi:MAG TPA: 4-carboxy-4-hydroxy-2-oxoadipate aldolase/oxaloacetate decarboxylase [Peptococcaceae bacterium]|nr:4-carboxy-4-hydroxy-2-oxoadipate aldolase/oxaloacetate decarboxylase [Peptococcaceae bacterium]